MKSLLVALLLALVCAPGEASSLDQHADKLANLIDPAKLATLGKRGANSCIQKAVAILAEAQYEKLDPGAVCAAAIETVKMKPAAGELTKAALLHNLKRAREFGCLDSAGQRRVPPLADHDSGQHERNPQGHAKSLPFPDARTGGQDGPTRKAERLGGHSTLYYRAAA